MVFAVYIPPQAPSPGQIAFSMRVRSSCDMLPALQAPRQRGRFSSHDPAPMPPRYPPCRLVLGWQEVEGGRLFTVREPVLYRKCDEPGFPLRTTWVRDMHGWHKVEHQVRWESLSSPTGPLQPPSQGWTDKAVFFFEPAVQVSASVIVNHIDVVGRQRWNMMLGFLRFGSSVQQYPYSQVMQDLTNWTWAVTIRGESPCGHPPLQNVEKWHGFQLVECGHTSELRYVEWPNVDVNLDAVLWLVSAPASRRVRLACCDALVKALTLVVRSDTSDSDNTCVSIIPAIGVPRLTSGFSRAMRTSRARRRIGKPIRLRRAI